MSYYRRQPVYRSDVGAWTRFVEWIDPIDHSVPVGDRMPRIALVETPDGGQDERVSEEYLHLHSVPVGAVRPEFDERPAFDEPWGPDEF